MPEPKPKSEPPPSAEMQWWSHLQDPLCLQGRALDDLPDDPTLRGVLPVDSNKPLLGEEDEPKSYDHVVITALVAEKLGMSHPYLLSDVEPYAREVLLDIRDDAHRVCKKLWQEEEALGDPDKQEALPLPPVRRDPPVPPCGLALSACPSGRSGRLVLPGSP